MPLYQTAAARIRKNDQRHLIADAMRAAPCDIEGHIGLDGKRYVLDFGRVFPPTYTAAVHKTYLYQHFRPEFLATYAQPLSSDMFSKFGGGDNSRVHNKEGVRAVMVCLAVAGNTYPVSRKTDYPHADNFSPGSVSCFHYQVK